ncbi:MAG: DUF3137 domain-containing protein [Proteobacteria bacterium]|nr:DUF3137 domain-containing protein [Pseudomonadota bacterium]
MATKEDLPEFSSYFVPSVKAFREKGGSLSIIEMESIVAEKMALSEDLRTVVHGDGPQTQFEYELAWVRTYLKKGGIAENSVRGVWHLTTKGFNVSDAELIDLPKKFTSHTVLKKTGFRAKNDYNPDPQNLEKILTGNRDFDKKFKTYSNYSIELNHDLTTSFIEKFIGVADLFKNKFMSAGFCENSFLIYLETSHRLFEPSQLYQQLNLVSESKKIINALNIIFESADNLQKNFGASAV